MFAADKTAANCKVSAHNGQPTHTHKLRVLTQPSNRPTIRPLLRQSLWRGGAKLLPIMEQKNL